jgi:hypothetical protein
MEAALRMTIRHRLHIIEALFLMLMACVSCVSKQSVSPVNKDYYHEIVEARDGDIVTIRGYIDGKGICNDPDPNFADPNSCKTAIFRRCPFAYVPIRIPYCNNSLQSNCILGPFTSDYYNSHPTAYLPYLRDDLKNPFSPGDEVNLTVVVGTRATGWKTVTEVKKIEVIPGSNDPVNVTCANADTIRERE